MKMAASTTTLSTSEAVAGSWTLPSFGRSPVWLEEFIFTQAGKYTRRTVTRYRPSPYKNYLSSVKESNRFCQLASALEIFRTPYCTTCQLQR